MPHKRAKNWEKTRRFGKKKFTLAVLSNSMSEIKEQLKVIQKRGDSYRIIKSPFRRGYFERMPKSKRIIINGAFRYVIYTGPRKKRV